MGFQAVSIVVLTLHLTALHQFPRIVLFTAAHMYGLGCVRAAEVCCEGKVIRLLIRSASLSCPLLWVTTPPLISPTQASSCTHSSLYFIAYFPSLLANWFELLVSFYLLCKHFLYSTKTRRARNLLLPNSRAFVALLTRPFFFLICHPSRPFPSMPRH